MFAHILAVFTALYDARYFCRTAILDLPKETTVRSLVSGASGALDLAEDHLTRRSTPEGKESIQQAAALLGEAVSLSSEHNIADAHLQTLETLQRSKCLQGS